jgi:hypothetical protein
MIGFAFGESRRRRKETLGKSRRQALGVAAAISAEGDAEGIGPGPWKKDQRWNGTRDQHT